jgi:hypothetical protein
MMLEGRNLLPSPHRVGVSSRIIQQNRGIPHPQQADLDFVPLR